MDPATLIGVLVGLVIIVVANMMEGGNPMSLLLLPPMLLVLGTTFMVTMAGGTIPDTKNAMKSLKTAFTAKVRPILAKNCFKCHGPDDKARKAKLRLDVRDAALKPAPARSVGALRVLHHQPFVQSSPGCLKLGLDLGRRSRRRDLHRLKLRRHPQPAEQVTPFAQRRP